MPASRAPATRMARATASVSKVAMATTGPKISSRMSRASWGTSARRTAAKKWPAPGTGPPGTTRRAPPGQGVLDDGLEAGHVRRGDQGPEPDPRPGAAPDPHAPHARGQAAGELLGHLAVHV